MNGFSEPLADHGVWDWDLETDAVRWSDSMFRIYGLGREEFTPEAALIGELTHHDDRPTVEAAVYGAIESGAPFTVQHRIVRPDGAIRTVILRGCVLPDPDGGKGRLVGTTRDVTGKIGLEEQLWHLANEDSLTGLYNRRRFLDELAREIAVAHRTATPGAVLMLDLDRFKDVNDSLGHMAGDRLLAEVADALRRRLRATDTLARLGGDEFAVVLPACPTEEACKVAAELGAAAGAPIKIAGRPRRVTASVGVAPFGTRGDESADNLLVEADLAMYRAKRSHSGSVEVFDEEMRAELAARLATEAELRAGVEDGDFAVVYQPIASMTDGSPVGCEALVRWVHPSRGIVPPAEFIPLAEEVGLIGAIGEFVLDRACEQASKWRAAGLNLYVSVNVSPLQLVGQDMVEVVNHALAKSELPAPLLCLEMTETALLDDARPMLPALRSLKDLGVRVAIDDFGGGSSSFGLLRMLPLDQIKVDRVFIEGISERPDDRAIVAAVLSMADELDLAVVAEGVENERQHWELHELGCRYAQGFLYAMPSDPDDLELEGYSLAVQPGVGDPNQIREFMKQIGIPARVRA
jgi:diguanylate cyclase (GGDEF)-like protein/PAS domain S-box-containing protein